MTMAGQTINDRLLAARHSLAGQGLAKSVCKATTEECIGPKKKHLDCELPCLSLSLAHSLGLSLRKSPLHFLVITQREKRHSLVLLVEMYPSNTRKYYCYFVTL